MVATKKTTTKKKTTKKADKEKMKAQSAIKFKLPESSYFEIVFTPFSADTIIAEFKKSWNDDGIFTTLIGVNKDNGNVNYSDDISKIKKWVPFALSAKYVQYIRGLINE